MPSQAQATSFSPDLQGDIQKWVNFLMFEELAHQFRSEDHPISYAVSHLNGDMVISSLIKVNYGRVLPNKPAVYILYLSNTGSDSAESKIVGARLQWVMSIIDLRIR